MAKKPAAPKKSPKAAEKTENTTVFTPVTTLNNLLKAARTLKSDLNDLTSANSTMVREAAEKKYLHVKAFNTIKMLDRMTPEKLADFMEHFDYYFEKSGLEERAASAPRMEGVGGPQGEEFEEDAPRETKNGDAGAGGFPAAQTH